MPQSAKTKRQRKQRDFLTETKEIFAPKSAEKSSQGFVFVSVFADWVRYRPPTLPGGSVSLPAHNMGPESEVPIQFDNFVTIITSPDG